MLCIAAFVVLVVLGAVSAKYRKLLRRAWSCVARRMTFRPCDSTFREDVKTSLLAPLALRAPRWVKPASVAIEVTAWIMVLSLVVSVYLLVRSGLNLFVYGTCDRATPDSCSLSSTLGCSVDSDAPSFWDQVTDGDVIGAFRDEFAALGETIATVPSRLRTWDAAEHAPTYASFLGGYTDGRATSLEILDPGCVFCGVLFENIEASGLAEATNVTYIVYPIEIGGMPRYANSPLIARYLTAIRVLEHDGAPAADPTDWAILRHVFTGRTDDGVRWQDWFLTASPDDARARLDAWLAEAGYDDAALAEVAALADSDQVAELLAEGRRIVDEDVRTVTVPTLIAGGSLHRGAVEIEVLEKIG